MLTSRETWRSQSPWNNIHYTFYEGQYWLLDWTAYLVVRNLVKYNPPTPKEQRLISLVYSLSESGLTNAQISELLNRSGVKTILGNKFTTKGIWDVINKYKKRLDQTVKREYAISVKFSAIGDVLHGPRVGVFGF